MRHRNSSDFEVVVIGGGHAGCEAALAAARLGAQVLLLTSNTAHLAHLPCNCSIGGTAKGHVAREVDALGGEMGRIADRAYTHIRMLNTSKGPAVQSLRAQVDVDEYAHCWRRALSEAPTLTLLQGQAVGFHLSGDRLTGVLTAAGDRIECGTAVVTAGTFLNGVMRVGELHFAAGRAGDPAALGLSDWYRDHGFEVGRLKTGTVPRVHRDTLDLGELHLQPADELPRWFSFDNVGQPRKTGMLECWATHTTEDTARIARANLHRSALYGGFIEGVGPRYCPSIEDKFVKFPDRTSHHLFLEQEGWSRPHVYVAGLSNSLPFEVQEEMVHSVPGLRRATVIRPGYAIEYDFVAPTELSPALETKRIHGLFHAGQLNGTSGYEEAAGQGLVAGINAVACLRGGEPLVLNRSEAYIGVMIDDLVTKGTQEPYRLFTSRAEFRLLLRQDNADQRLTPHGRGLGLIPDERWERFRAKRETLAAERRAAEQEVIRPTEEANRRLVALGSAPLKKPHTVADLIKRPELGFGSAWQVAGQRRSVIAEIATEVETDIKYQGYLQRQEQERERFVRREHETIPESFDYRQAAGLRREAQERLSEVRPNSLGRASRVPGVTPADVSVLSVHLHRLRQDARK